MNNTHCNSCEQNGEIPVADDSAGKGFNGLIALGVILVILAAAFGGGL